MKLGKERNIFRIGDRKFNGARLGKGRNIGLRA